MGRQRKGESFKEFHQRQKLLEKFVGPVPEKLSDLNSEVVQGKIGMSLNDPLLRSSTRKESLGPSRCMYKTGVPDLLLVTPLRVPLDLILPSLSNFLPYPRSRTPIESFKFPVYTGIDLTFKLYLVFTLYFVFVFLTPKPHTTIRWLSLVLC